MDTLNLDNICSIASHLSLHDILRLIETCKAHTAIINTLIYNKLKSLYHDPDENFILINDDERSGVNLYIDKFAKDQNKNSYTIKMKIDNITIMYIYNHLDINEVEYYVGDKLYNMLEYPEDTFLSDKYDEYYVYYFDQDILDKVKRRFNKDLHIDRFLINNWSIIPNEPKFNNQNDRLNYYIEQVKLLYYTLKFFSKDIISSFHSNVRK